MDEHKNHVFGLALVAVIGMGALVMMFSQASVTGQATLIKAQLVPVTQCNAGKVLVGPSTVDALRVAGREANGQDYSPYTDGGCEWLPRVGYCCKESELRTLLG